MAFFDNELIGFLHFKQIGDLIDCSNVLVKEKYRNHNVATKLMSEAFLETNKRNIKILVAHAVEHDGVVNAKRLLEKFSFEEIYNVKNYWRSLYPGEFCKQCKSNDCHCGVVVYLKRIY